jgi:chromosomal replication initiation ATPase DnaA
MEDQMPQSRPLPVAADDAARRAGLSQIVAAQAFGVPLAAVLAGDRGTRATARVRQIAMYLSHVVFSIDGDAVARIFGRSRSAAYHAFRRVETLRDDPDINRTLCRLEEMLRSAAGVM